MGDGYLLTSFDRYNDVEPIPVESAFSIEEEVEVAKEPTEDTTAMTSDTLLTRKPYKYHVANFKMHFRYHPDTIEYFDKQLFILKGDTLVKMDNLNAPSIKYWKPKADVSLKPNAH